MATGTSTERLSYAQLEALWLQAGGPADQAAIAAAVAEAESSGNTTATNTAGNSAGVDQGLWQINSYYNPYFAHSGNPFDPLQNAQAAVYYYKTRGWRDWVTYTTGAYRQYLQSNVPPNPTGIQPAIGIPSIPGVPNPTDPKTWISALASVLGVPDLKDLAERLGLILLGTTLLLIGIWLNTQQTGRSVISAFTSGKKKVESAKAPVETLNKISTSTGSGRAMRNAANA